MSAETLTIPVKTAQRPPSLVTVPPGWMQLASGHGVDLSNPTAADIDWHDIAQSLSLLCRFTGHLANLHNFYSVAQHSVVVSDLLPEPYKLYGLLHDAHEAYWGDDATPKKRALASTFPDAAVWLESRKAAWDAAVWEAAGIEPPDAEARTAIKEADYLALAIEHKCLQRPAADDTTRAAWAGLPDPGRFQIIAVSPNAAHDLFMGRLSQLIWPTQHKEGVA